MNIEQLNKKYQDIDPLDRIKVLFEDFAPSDILITSSFGTTAAIVLDMVSKVNVQQPIYTLDTGYLFEETKVYQAMLTKHMNLKVKTLRAESLNHDFTKNNKTYVKNQDLCCYINKVQPLDKIKAKHKIWVSGLLGYQNENRQNKVVFEQKKGIVKCYPIIDLPKDMVDAYKMINELPEHPLLNEGYESIGCTHCTAKGAGREGRWAGETKTECGLHT